VPTSNALELLKFLLEALHEELNRIKFKPPTRKIHVWPEIKENLSAIVCVWR